MIRPLLIVGIISLFACASYYIDRGDAHAASGEWDAAFERFQQAIESDPENGLARGKLERARSQAATMHAEHARLAARNGSFTDAISSYRRSLAYIEDSRTRELLIATVAAKRRADAQEELVLASRAEGLNDLLTARDAYERAKVLDPDLAQRVQPKIRDISGQIAEAARVGRRAQRAFEEGNFDRARQIADHALGIHSKEPAAMAVIEDVDTELAARDAEAEARVAAARNDLETAITLAREAVAARSTPDREGLLKSLEDRLVKQYLRDADSASARNDWVFAVEKLKSARSLRPSDGDIVRRLEEARFQSPRGAGPSCKEILA